MMKRMLASQIITAFIVLLYSWRS